MNILAFLNAYSQGKSGADVCFVEVYKRMKGVKLTIVTSELGKQFCEGNGLKATYIITTSETRFANPLLTYLIRIWKSLFIKIDFDTIDNIYSSSDALPDTFAAVYFKNKYTKTWIGNIFHLVPSNRIFSYLSQKISHFFMKHTDSILIDNPLLRAQLEEKGFKKLVVRYPGISIPEKIKTIPKKYDAITISRIHQSKNIEDLIEIWKKVIDKLPNKKLGIIGTGEKEYSEYMQTKIKENNLEKNIKLLGYLSKEESFALLNSSELFVFSSHEEGFGIAVGEALATDKRVIAYDLPAFQNTFKKYITTIPCFDTQKFSEEIIKSFQQKQPVKNDIVKRFSWEKAVEIEQNLYE